MEDYSEKTEVEKRVEALTEETERLVNEYKETKKKIDDLYSANGLDADKRKKFLKWLEDNPMPEEDKAEAEKALRELEKEYEVSGAGKTKKTSKAMRRRGRMAI